MNVTPGFFNLPHGLQLKLAALLLISPAYLSAIKNGKKTPSRLAAEAWKPVTGWTHKRWKSAPIKDRQRMLLTVARKCGLMNGGAR